MGRLKNFDRYDVLDSAIQLFWKKGFADTSLSDLEKATGVNKSGLYSEFKDKDDIFLECIKRYHDTNPANDALMSEPLGWINIEDFFKITLNFKGQRGCFLANSTRDFNILPTKIRQVMDQRVQITRELMLNNIKATKTKNDPLLLTDMIMTYATGISLKLNIMKSEELRDELEAFLEMCKK